MHLYLYPSYVLIDQHVVGSIKVALDVIWCTMWQLNSVMN